MKKLLQFNILLIISIGLGLGLTITILQGFIISGYVDDLSENTIKIKQHYEVVEGINNLNKSLLLMESYSRGYVISDNKEFLKDYEEWEAEAKIQSRILYKHTTYSLFDEKDYNILNQLVEDKIAFINMIIITNDTKGTQAAVDIIKAGKGSRLMNKIVLLSDNISRKSKAALVIFHNSENFYMQKVTLWRVYFTITGILIIIITAFSLFRDIKNRNRFENDLKIEKMKAEKSALVKEQFLANMSHEIRTPMNAIIGFTNLLEKTKLDNKQTDYIGSIKSAGAGLLTIINDILDVSKIDAGMLRIEKIRFSIPGLMDSVRAMFSQKAHDKKLDLTFMVDGKIPEVVLGDPTRLTQILINLISNSVKFTNEGGIIVKSKLISEDSKNVKVEFTVKDSGIGISEEKLNAVFERFDQGNPETTREYGGTGFGLAIVKKLVDLQEGTIYVSSKPGKGAEFSFAITYSKANSNGIVDKPKGLEIKKIDALINVLIVEDNLMNQKLVAEVIHNFGFEVSLAGNGEIAIEMLKNADFDIVLMDIQMPVLDGYSAARKIRDELKLKMPIIAMTAHVMTGEKEKCISYGMTDYISKPFNEINLYSILMKHLPSSTTNSKKEKVIELNYLNEISKGNGVFVAEMIDIFLEQTPIDLKNIEEAISKDNFELIKAIAHKMKSSIRFIGLDDKIENDLNAMENVSIENRNIEFINKHFGNVKSVCAKAMEELKEHKTANKI